MIISYFCIAWRLAFYFVLCPYRSIQRSSGRFPPARGTRFQTGILLWLIKEQSEMTYQYVTYLYHYGILRQTNRWLWERLLLTSSYHSPAPPSDNLAAATIPSLSRSLFCPRFTLFTTGLFFSQSSFMFLPFFIFHKYLRNFLPGLKFSINFRSTTVSQLQRNPTWTEDQEPDQPQLIIPETTPTGRVQYYI